MKILPKIKITKRGTETERGFNVCKSDKKHGVVHVACYRLVKTAFMDIETKKWTTTFHDDNFGKGDALYFPVVANIAWRQNDNGK